MLTGHASIRCGTPARCLKLALWCSGLLVSLIVEENTAGATGLGQHKSSQDGELEAASFFSPRSAARAVHARVVNVASPGPRASVLSTEITKEQLAGR